MQRLQRLHTMTYVHTQVPWQSCIAAPSGSVFSVLITAACVA